MIECRASTFPLVNSTKVSTAVHSTRYFNSQLFHGQRVTFWRLLSLIVNIYWHRQRRGLSSSPFPPVQQVQLEAGTHPVTVGFSTVWPSLTTEVPCFSTRAVYYCVCGLNNPSTGLLSRAAFSLTCVTNCLPIHCL